MGHEGRLLMPLLSLVPPSCMVVPIRDLENKSVLFSSNIHSQQNFQLPTVFLMNYIGMNDFISGSSPDNFDNVRGRTFSSKLQVSKDSSMSSTKSSVIYHKKMECNNTIDIDVSSALLYETIQKKAFHVSKVANTSNNMVTMTHQYVFNEHTNTLLMVMIQLSISSYYTT